MRHSTDKSGSKFIFIAILFIVLYLGAFGFNIKDFIANTTRLNTEAKGAYLMLLLDYYQNEQGPPDIAKVLATITVLPLDAWLEHSMVILPLFEIRDGRLWHPRCEDEIEKGRKLYGQRVASTGLALEVSQQNLQHEVPLRRRAVHEERIQLRG